MLQLNESEVAIHFCTFQAYLQKAKVNLRFPSLFFVEWKTINGKNSVGMVGRRRANNSLIELNETLSFNTEMLYHRAQKQYLKKESLFHLNLISNSRPDQVKLVGRVVIDLSEIANTNKYSSVTTSKLMYCSVDADISFSLRLARSIESNLELNDLDRSSFSDLYSFTTPLRNVPKNKADAREGLSDRRIDEERRKIKAKVIQREEGGYNPVRNSRKDAKTENILIKDLVEESEEKSVPQSLPLTEKKPVVNLLEEGKVEVTQQQQVKNGGDAEFQARIYKEKDILERELNDHKNKIKKLETDIKDAMKLFQQSQQNSEINKSKLVESQEIINNLKANEAKIRQFYQSEVQKTKESGLRELQLLKSGFEADRKILVATIEELKFKAQDSQASQRIIEENRLLQTENTELKEKLNTQQRLLEDMKKYQVEQTGLLEQRLRMLEEIQQKDNQILNLSQQNSGLKTGKDALFAQLEIIKTDITNKNNEIQALKEEIIREKQSITLQAIPKEAVAPISMIDHEQLENYQKLQEEHKKIILELQTLKKSILFPQDYKKNLQQKGDLFVIIEKSQLQDIQISELKQENATMREKMQQLITQHEQLKSEKNGRQQLNYKEQLEKQIQMFNLMKEELAFVKEEDARHLQAQQKLQEEIKVLIDKLSNTSSQFQSLQLLRIQLQESQNQNIRLNNEIQNLKKASVPLQNDAILPIKPMQAVKFSEEVKENATLKGNHEQRHGLINIEEAANVPLQIPSQESPGKNNTDSKSLGLLQEHHDHQHHDFNFEEHSSPLTHEELNKMLQVKEVNRDEMQYLMDQIFKLKEEIEQLKSAKCYRKSESDLGQEQHSPYDQIVKLQDEVKKKTQQNDLLNKEILALKEQHTQEEHKGTLSSSNEALTEQIRQLQQLNQEHQKNIFDLECHLQELQKKNEQLEAQAKHPHDPFEKENNFIRELQAKIANLEEQLRIKDDLLAEGERNIEQNYTIKYQLADLKDKFSEIKSALEEKEEVINYLEEAKEQLSKELEQVGDKQRHSGFMIEPREILIETPKNEIDFGSLEVENTDLKNQVQSLRKELISLSNNQIQLRNMSELAANQKLSAEREKQEYMRKLEQAMTMMNKLQAQVNELSFMINGLNTQVERGKDEVNNLNEEINNLSLKNNETALQVDDLRQKNEELNSKIKIVQSQSAFISAQPIPEPINNNQIDSLKVKYTQKQQEIRIKQETIVQANTQLQALKKKVEELTAQNHTLLQRIENEGKVDFPVVAVHEVDSINEVNPVQYEKSIIPLYQREELERIERDLRNDPRNEDIDLLKSQIEDLKKQVAKEISQKNSYYNALETANSKILELQLEAMTMKEQIEKFTSLPIQSFNYMATPVKPQYRFAETCSRNVRQPSIIYQPRVKGEMSDLSAIINPPQKESLPEESPQKHAFSKNVETRVETNVVNEEQAEMAKKQMEILKEQLESEQKLHRQLQEIHNICEKKYELLNNHYENCLQQLNNFKAENGELTSERQNIANELHFVKEAYLTLQNEYDSLLAQHNKLKQEAPLATPAENTNFAKEMQEKFLEQKRQYEEKLLVAVKNEERLSHKIQHLEENIFNLEKSLQDHIEMSQSNDKITQKLEQLNELQTIAAQFKQEIEQAKLEKEQLAIVQGENELLKKEVSEMLKIVDEHRNCASEKSQWQTKLLNIQNLLSNNENRFAGQKQQLENRLNALNEEKASLVAQKSAIHENLKRESEIAVNHQEIASKEAQLVSEIHSLRNEKLNEMQKVADLQEKINIEQQSRNKREAELEEAVIVRQQEVEEVKFINSQLNQQFQDLKLLASQHQKCASVTQQVQSLQSKIEQQANLTSQYELLIHNLRNQVQTLQGQKANENVLEQLHTELSILQEEISQKIMLIEEQQERLVRSEEELYETRTKIAQLQEQLAKNQQEMSKLGEETNKYKEENTQLLAIKGKIENQLKAVNGRYAELENAIKSTNKLTEARDKNAETLRSEINKKEKEINDLNIRIRSKEADILNMSKQLDSWKVRSQSSETKIQQLAQKERLMKETMDIIERQSIRIVESLKGRYESEEVYYRQCIEKQKENNRLSLAATEIRQELQNKQRALAYSQERIGQLANEIELLKKGQGDQEANPAAVTIQYQKYEKLMEKNEQLLSKNRQYLEIISNKSASTVQNEKLKRQIKQILQQLSEYQQNYTQLQRKWDEKVPELEKQLLTVTSMKGEMAEKIEALQRELSEARQGSTKDNHACIENILLEKDKQINSLRKGFKKEKESDILESNDDNISILNEQILNLNREILEKDNELNKLKTEIQISKVQLQPQQQDTQQALPFDQQKQKLMNELQERERRQQEYKQSIKRLREQLKTGNALPRSDAKEGAHLQQMGTISNELHYLCEEIKELCLKRSSPQESDKLFHAFIQKYDLMEEQFGTLSSETSIIQEKAKFISKELQRIKSFVIKSQNRGFKEKTELLALIKPCENAASELVNISETLSEKESQNFI